MKAYVGVTDFDWFSLLSAQAPNEVNFWQPSGRVRFRALDSGDLFLFKLHAPRNFIVGGGIFAHFSLLPMSLAWSAFGPRNGVQDLCEMRSRISRYRRSASDSKEDFTIGCIVLTQPFFLQEAHWVQVPTDWRPNIVRGKTYDLHEPHGFALLERVRTSLEQSISTSSLEQELLIASNSERFGQPTTITPRLGQGGFKILVTDAYERSCAITGGRVLPVLEAAHIRPYSEEGAHSLSNGLLLRSDLHTLFDRGYLTVTPEYRVEVSRRIRDEFANGKSYYALHGHEVHLPHDQSKRPSRENLVWHNESTYLG